MITDQVLGMMNMNFFLIALRRVRQLNKKSHLCAVCGASLSITEIPATSPLPVAAWIGMGAILIAGIGFVIYKKRK
ncbi:hypothetical protein ASU35_10860 [Acetivibrio ethanolgignens]|uniref:Uncharacterized protein n=2 Tax=Acetivibrio ethanolgignens TaxID=290052 RepID=A0A0V8QEE7_9FIRM|nr:LPXTG cell wall anchor domain-containing protein [Acetivibrio ethanolgignens]KSV58919.1 hypothetical protein ASU35_10860 [Acetivibrio ethanolgignens]